MSATRHAFVLAASPSVTQAASIAFESAQFAATFVESEALKGATEVADQERLMTQLLKLEPDVCVIGDEIFPEGVAADHSLAIGMLRTFVTSRLVVRTMMRNRFGRVVAIMPPLDRTMLDRSAMVGAMSGLIRTLAREVGSRGITANIVSPGYFNIEDEQPSPYLSVGRWCDPSDVAQVLGFIISQASSYVTGQIITVDGGLGA